MAQAEPQVFLVGSCKEVMVQPQPVNAQPLGWYWKVKCGASPDLLLSRNI